MDTDPEMTDEQLEQWAENLRASERIRREWAEREYMGVLAKTTLKPFIYMLRRPTTDAHGTVTIGVWGGYLIQLMPMAFNDRLVMTPQDNPYVYDFGWCFPKGGAAYLATLAWDPETQAEPMGFIKRVANYGTRTAGEKALPVHEASQSEMDFLRNLLGGDPKATNLVELLASLESK